MLSESTSSHPYISVPERKELKTLLSEYKKYLETGMGNKATSEAYKPSSNKDELSSDNEMFNQLKKIQKLDPEWSIACAITTHIRNESSLTPLIENDNETMNITIRWLKDGPICKLNSSQIILTYLCKTKTWSRQQNDLSNIKSDILDCIKCEIANGDNFPLIPLEKSLDKIVNSNQKTMDLTLEEIQEFETAFSQ